MKIIMTAAAPSLDADIDPRFGRGAYLLEVDTDTLEFEAHANPGVTAGGGAGIQAAQMVSGKGASAVVSGDFGPNAFQAFQAAGISMYLYGECKSVREAIEQFKTGKLQPAGLPTRGGHRQNPGGGG